MVAQSILFLRQGLAMLPRLSWNLLCSPGWPWTGDLPASGSGVLALQMCVTMPNPAQSSFPKDTAFFLETTKWWWGLLSCSYQHSFQVKLCFSCQPLQVLNKQTNCQLPLLVVSNGPVMSDLIGSPNRHQSTKRSNDIPPTVCCH
jgi:hypothetical protein